MMTSIILRPQALTADAFAPFGELIEVAEQSPIMINEGTTERFDSLATVQLAKAEDRAIISVFRAQPRQLPMRIKMLERHPHGSQAFIPLSQEPYLVLVASGDQQPELNSLQLFLAQAHQGINYYQNTWHHPVLGLNTVCDFLVVDRKGAGNNCDEYFFDEIPSIQIELNL